jgi:hypothetical protein
VPSASPRRFGAAFGELVTLNRDAYLPDLAASMTNLAVWLGEAGRCDH